MPRAPETTLQALLRQLRAILPAERVRTRPEDLLTYGYDANPNFDGLPDAVVFPVNAEEVARVLGAAHRLKMPVVPRGAGTNVSGATIPLGGGLVLCTSKMNRVLGVDPARMTVTVEPGVVLQELNRRLAAQGLFFPPDPQSFFAATIGGMLAENSGGPACVKYGVTKQYVQRIEAVLPGGGRHTFGGHSLHAFAGLDLLALLVGSEGTLGVITQATLRVVHLPAARRMVIAAFEAVATAGDIVHRVLGAGVVPAKIELLDRWFIRASDAFTRLGIPADSAAVVFFECDGSAQATRAETDLIQRICRDNGASRVRLAEDQAEADRYWAARRAGYQMTISSAPNVLDYDLTVPLQRIPDLLSGIQALERKYGLEIPVLGHAGDGNMHPDILTDKNDPEWYGRAEAALAEMVALTLDLGGVISGEHGVGLEKIAFVRRDLGDAVWALSKRLKRALDPNGIMNPGKVWQ